MRLVPNFIGRMSGTSNLDLIHLCLEPFTLCSISLLQKKNSMSSLEVDHHTNICKGCYVFVVLNNLCNAFLLYYSLLYKASLCWGLWQPSNVPLRLVTTSHLDGGHMRHFRNINRNNKFCRCIGCYCLAVLQIKGEYLWYDIQTTTSLLSPTWPYSDLWIRKVYLILPMWLVLIT